MKNAIICWIIGGIILGLGILFLNANEGKFDMVEAKITNVEYLGTINNRRYVITYEYYNTKLEKMETGKTTKDGEEFILPPSRGDKIKVTVTVDTHEPTEGVHYDEGLLKLAVYGFGGFFLIGGCINLVVGIFKRD